MTAMKTAEARARRMKEGTDRRRGGIPFPSPSLVRDRASSRSSSSQTRVLHILLSSVLSFSFLELSQSSSPVPFHIAALYSLSIPLSFTSSNLLDSIRRDAASLSSFILFRYFSYVRDRISSITEYFETSRKKVRIIWKMMYKDGKHRWGTRIYIREREEIGE